MANTTYIDIAESSKNRGTVVGAEFVGAKYISEKNAAAEIEDLDVSLIPQLKPSFAYNSEKNGPIEIEDLGFSFVSLFNKDFAFDTTKTYSKDDIVSKDGELYKAKADNTTGTWDEEKWTRARVNEALAYALAN